MKLISFPNVEWSNEDPRVVLVDQKRADLVVVRKSPFTRSLETTLGSIEMEYGWWIDLDFKEGPKRPEVWDAGWWWILAPDLEES